MLPSLWFFFTALRMLAVYPALSIMQPHYSCRDLTYAFEGSLVRSFINKTGCMALILLFVMFRLISCRIPAGVPGKSKYFNKREMSVLSKVFIFFIR
jgi:hypothetical protein